MSKCFVSLSFDDARIDNYENAFPILEKNGIKATFHIITGFVDGSKNVHISKGYHPCSIDNIIDMFNHGHEISSHSDDHSVNFDSVMLSFEKLAKWHVLTGYSLSLPHSDDTFLFDERVKNFEFKYIRTGKNNDRMSLFNKSLFGLYSLTKNPLFYSFYNRININYFPNINVNKLVSIPVKMDDDVKTIIHLIDKYKDKDVWIILMFHSILDDSEQRLKNDKWSWSTKNFEILCSYLSNNSIITLPIVDVVNNLKI